MNRPIYLNNTLTRRKEPLRTERTDRVTMYVCGPTVYNYAHIGNARPAVVFDVLSRLLRQHYPEVVYARNFTDVDDKINAAASAAGLSIGAITDRHINAYHEDMHALGVLAPDLEPRATEPMFPRYLFIRLDSSDQGKSWSPIRSTLGVSQLVHFGARAAKVDDTLVDLLRQREQALPTEAMFHSGDAVVIADGPFAGIEAIYQTVDAERRAFILLEILAKPVSMHIDAGRLRKAG